MPVVLALGANTPLYEPLWDIRPGCATRVPERLLPIACLYIAALAAFAVSRIPWRYAALVAIPLVALDLRVDVYRPMGAAERNPVYTELRSAAPGRVLERPVIIPELQEGSVYLYYSMQAPRGRARLLRRRPRARRTAPRALLRGLDPKTLGVHWIVLYRGGKPALLSPP